MNPRIESFSFSFPQTILGRVVAGLVAATLFVLAFFFLFFVLLAAGVLILGLSLRALWRARRARAEASRDVIEGEYSVQISDVQWLDDAAADTTQKH